MRELEILKQKFINNRGKRMFVGEYEIALLNEIIFQFGIEEFATKDNRLTAEREFNDALLIMFILQEWKRFGITKLAEKTGEIFPPATQCLIDNLAFELRPLETAIKILKDEIQILQITANPNLPNENLIDENSVAILAFDLISMLRSGAGLRMINKHFQAINTEIENNPNNAVESVLQKMFLIKERKKYADKNRRVLSNRYQTRYLTEI
ncbi:MAG: hypothetical protein LBE36_13400 [Flavobacteriaceae bacterium]|jgi:hypothetical protein|nr:hypothetical protein [Flavobacteriaceae bacterium]